mmetsp:Transcript_28270/g.38684  ORF Transcript_28270/g.38684 Transcript_28270/m.38684 type:complete len:204 (+) Transcript_28270:1499-2110(+)
MLRRTSEESQRAIRSSKSMRLFSTSLYSTTGPYFPLIRATSSWSSLLHCSSSFTRFPGFRHFWMSTTLSRYPGYWSKKCSNPISFRATPLRRWQTSIPPMMIFVLRVSSGLGFMGCAARVASERASAPGDAICLSTMSVSMDTWRMTTQALWPWYVSRSSPPERVSRCAPRFRLQALRKWRAWAKAWKPTMSAQSMLVMRSLP